MQNWKKVTASTDMVVPAGVKLSRVRLVANGGTPVSAVFYNAAVQGVPGDANDFLTLAANGTFDSDKENFSDKEGMKTLSGVSVTITGVGAALYVYWF